MNETIYQENETTSSIKSYYLLDNTEKLGMFSSHTVWAN